MEKAKKKILVAPLDWGLGHAARCVPVIKELLENNAEVIIAADRQPLAFLRKEFPGIETMVLPGYEISYPAPGGSMIFKMAFQLPKISAGIKRENKALQRIIREKNINGVISDQRFGLYTPLVSCVFITHQVMIKAPFFENTLYKTNRKFIDKYSGCWIPDTEGEENLSGDLSHKFPLPPNARFIGPLSRFHTGDLKKANGNFQYDIMAIISGPEPQRTVFEKMVLDQLENSELKAVIVRGVASADEHSTAGNIEMHSHLGSAEMAEKFRTSRIIIARAGYSTIMDLAASGKRAILVPTPGQTEQEYLAAYHYRKKNFFLIAQDRFNLREAYIAALSFPGMHPSPHNNSLKLAVKEFTENC